MPLMNIHDDPVPTADVACAVCKKVSSHPLVGLHLGVSAEDTNQIPLPPCTCGAQEFLFRTFDGEDDRHAGHRKAVNAVAQWLKGAGRVHPEAADAVQAETVKPKLTRPLFGPV